MPWGSNYLYGRNDGYYGQTQAGPYNAQGYGLNLPRLFGFNRTQQAGANVAQQAGSNIPRQLRRQPAWPMQPMRQTAQQLPQFQQPAQQAPQLRQPMQLPDGVQLHPINNVANLINGFNFKSSAQQAAAAETAADNPALREEQKLPERTEDLMGNSLRELIQDEYNSSRFYTFMAEQAPRSVYADYFKQESGNCRERVSKLNELYGRHADTAFSPIDTEINTQIDFNTGVSWAVAVESGALKKFGAIYENAPDEQSARKIFTQICGKISHIMMIILIMQNRAVTM